MYKYSELARAEMIAGETVSTLKNMARTISNEPTMAGCTQVLYQLGAVDDLEGLWRQGRYLGFIHTLRKLFFADLDIDLSGTIAESLIQLTDYEDILFEYMSCRSDASFSEGKGLFKWAMLKKSLTDKEAPSSWKAFRTFVSTKEGYTEIDFFGDSLTLLTEMSNVLFVADLMLEFEKTANYTGFGEVHNTIRDIGALDRWRKF